jgi:hypothetical protein
MDAAAAAAEQKNADFFFFEKNVRCKKIECVFAAR